MNTILQCVTRHATTAACGVLILALCGCGSDPVPPASASTPPRSGVAAAAPATGVGGSNNAANLAGKSSFHNTTQSGRDPFFPDSRRSATQATDPAPIRLPIVSYLKLFGVRSGTARPMALINRTPFAPGEERDVSITLTNQSSKPEVQKVSVRCLEIRRDSVVIRIAGEHGVKELRMAQAK